MHWKLVIPFALSFATQVLSASSYCEGSVFCAIGSKDAANNIQITIHSSAQGFVALGIGSSMAKSSMYLAWKNSTGGIMLVSRDSTGYRPPQPSPERIAILVPTPANIPTPSWAVIAFTFKRPAISTIMSIEPQSEYIYSMSDTPTRDPDSLNSVPGIHSKYGFIRGVDFTISSSDSGSTSFGNGGSSGAVLTLPAGTTFDYILRVHGILMVVAWVISPAIGIFVARFLKTRLGAIWYSLHIFFMLVVTGILTTASIVLIYLYKRPPHFSDNYHEVIGLVVAIGMLVQYAVGFVSNATFNPKRTSIPIVDKLHWWLGRGLVVLGIINVFFGLSLYGSMGYPISVWFSIGVGIVLGVITVVFVAGQMIIGQIHHDATTDELFK
ncbi:hypothetical protein BASA50_001172 [Batrachochytrium salamandrivorans]|uniref:Cytochrome b561 domain-containing protein n=1 Tax=Batrachochytrium salamandrivorans TaxID=1357716 RepID=A0ABQ8ERU6_9FUNG|nr:hypothetical protein BASA60_008844 [Batrachochytrium salamandrivorans]KAH6578075.1 hypothetical protein BASA62_000515 [Batrachochytrium salamandrivorans]KAH6579159.1 hypothetical protein BASA61_010461 [Batrachochytrium salamandrivorans]KAH6585563.1 hypothetical protein BASA50_001172 [Batrachochytrium salamandrivorans]KAH9248857.1 hypothetical protein BASA81_013467 [Batrachochytrium salamandrivorans]